MEKKILSLSAEGKIVVKSPEERQYPVFPEYKAVVHLLIDCSSSMCGEKFYQAQQGALDFARTAIRKGYLVGLIVFRDIAFFICEPTRDVSLIADRIGKLPVIGSTNLTDALKVVSRMLLKKTGYRAVVVATDGRPNDPNSALKIAEAMKQDHIEILVISTADADQNFLSRLASRKDLNLMNWERRSRNSTG